MNHYRCHQVYVPSKKIGKNRTYCGFPPHNFATPQASPLNDAARAADLLTSALKGHVSETLYNAPTDAQMKAIQQISDIFQKLTRTQLAAENTLPRVRTITHPPRVPETPTPHPVCVSPYSTPLMTYNVPTLKDTSHIILPNDDKHLFKDYISADDDHNPWLRYNLRLCAPVACSVANQSTVNLEGYTKLMHGPDKDT